MSGHTPGPWHLTFGESGWFEVATSAPVDDMGRMLITSRSSINHRAGESVANAHLIAAAPDLLAACELSLDVFGRGVVGEALTDAEAERFDAILHLTAAVAKAKGGVR